MKKYYMNKVVLSYDRTQHGSTGNSTNLPSSKERKKGLKNEYEIRRGNKNLHSSDRLNSLQFR